MTRASVDSRLRFGFSIFGVWVLLSATGFAASAFGACVAVWTAAGRSTYFGASTVLGASTAIASAVLGCSAAAGSSFDASERLRELPACAVADTRTNAAIRMNLRM